PDIARACVSAPCTDEMKMSYPLWRRPTDRPGAIDPVASITGPWTDCGELYTISQLDDQSRLVNAGALQKERGRCCRSCLRSAWLHSSRNARRPTSPGCVWSTPFVR